MRSSSTRALAKRILEVATLLGVVAFAAIPTIALADIVVPPQASRGSPIAVPAGNQPYLEGHVLPGNGVQIYQCNSAGTGWTFLRPDAILSSDDGASIIHHFTGPTWQSLEDGSSVMGTKLASMASPSGAIPWLLLKARNNTLGPQGGDELYPTTYIQRVNTTGGVAPQTPCIPGTMESVPYTADYIFYDAVDSQS